MASKQHKQTGTPDAKWNPGSKARALDIFRQGVVQSCTLGAWREHYRWWGECFQLVGFFLEFGLCLWDAKADNFGISVRNSDLLLVIDVWPIGKGNSRSQMALLCDKWRTNFARTFAPKSCSHIWRRYCKRLQPSSRTIPLGRPCMASGGKQADRPLPDADDC